MLRVLLLLVSLVGLSLQGGAKPQQNGGGSPLYQPEYIRGVGAQQPGPLGAKSGGKYPQYSPQGYQQGPSGLRNGYGGVKAGNPVSGLGQLPQAGKQKPGYGGAGSYLGNILGQGLGGKASKAGYGYPNMAAQAGYGNGAAGYPNMAQPGYGAKPSKSGYGAPSYPQYGEPAGAAGYPQYGAQAGYGNGAGLQQPGYGGKLSKAGYRNGIGSYPNNYPQQQGIAGKPPKAGYGNGAGLYPSAAALQGGIGKPSKVGLGAKGPKAGPFQQPYGGVAAAYQGNEKGIRTPLGGFQGPAQMPVQSQPLPADPLGYRPAKYAGAKSQYGAQSGYPDPTNAKYAGAKSQYGAQSGYPDPANTKYAGAKSQYGAQSGYPDPKYAGARSQYGAQSGYPDPKYAGAKSQYGAQSGYPDPANTKYAGAKSQYGAQSGYPDPANTKYAGAKSQYGAQSGYPDPTNTKYAGAKSQYGGQSGYPDPAGGKYAGAAQSPYTAQPGPQGPLEEEISPSASVEGTQNVREGGTTPPQATPPAAQRPSQGGYQQLGAAQNAWTYGPEESAYTQNGYYGNSYRGCGGKC